ncbi:MAG: ABC transporter substrate-binding protein [Clostridia bacterium]|nr:ABC transporter substrate-binding protein [Clostridia bacterium]
MKKFFAAMLALAMLLSLCSFAAAEDAIIIGISGPLTGPYAMYGLGVVNGAQIAIDEINALGGLQFAMVDEDDEGDPEKAVNAYNTMLDQGAAVMVGTVTSGACAAVAAEAYNDRVFMLTPSASSPTVTEGRDNVFQVCFTDPGQGAASAQYIVDHNLATKVAVIYNNGQDYSTGIFQTFEAKAKELGLEIVSIKTFSSDDNADFSVQLADAKENGAELVFLPIYYTPASMVLQQAKNMDYAPIFFGVDGMDGILDIEGFDTTLAEGVYLLTAYSADAQDEKTQNFVAKYQEIYGGVPNQFAADAYDAVYALYEACNAAGVTAEMANQDEGFAEVCELLIPVMPTLTIEGITGTMTWNATGEVDKTPTAVVINNGVYTGVQ